MPSDPDPAPDALVAPHSAPKPRTPPRRKLPALEASEASQPSSPKPSGWRKLDRVSINTISQIAALVRRGAYPHVAAQACGLSAHTFRKYMLEGAQLYDLAKDSGRDFSTTERRLIRFYLAITKAKSDARMGAEIVVRDEKPLEWLTKGPARETGNPDDPGWGSPEERRDVTVTIQVQAGARIKELFGVKDVTGDAGRRIVGPGEVTKALPQVTEQGPKQAETEQIINEKAQLAVIIR